VKSVVSAIGLRSKVQGSRFKVQSLENRIHVIRSSEILRRCAPQNDGVYRRVSAVHKKVCGLRFKVQRPENQCNP